LRRGEFSGGHGGDAVASARGRKRNSDLAHRRQIAALRGRGGSAASPRSKEPV
jgi:hypothetical protein